MIKLFLVKYLEKLITEFDRYIPDKNLAFQLWVRNPFLAKDDALSDDVAGLQEKLIDLHQNEIHRRLFITASRAEF